VLHDDYIVETRCCSVCSAGDEVLAGDQTFQYFTSEDMKTLQDDSMCSTAKVSPHYIVVGIAYVLTYSIYLIIYLFAYVITYLLNYRRRFGVVLASWSRST